MLKLIHKQTRIHPGPAAFLTRRWMSTVYTFGDGSQGALGHPTSSTALTTDAYEPAPVPGLPSDVSAVSAGHYHSLAVTGNGQLWTWGRNSELQLGRGPDSAKGSWNKPQMVEGLDYVRVKAAFASGVVSAAVGEDGSLWVWGTSKRGQLGLGGNVVEGVLPARVEGLVDEEIVKVSFGWGHALALTKDGKLFGWGYYADGRLGQISETMEASPLDSIASRVKSRNGDSKSMIETAEKLVLEAIEKEKDMPIIWEPTLIRELCDKEAVDIACGLDHSLILCRDGTLLSGGSNVYGQLGRQKEDLGLHLVDMSLRPISIASGLGHSLAICSAQDNENERCVVTWGWNQSSQLGREGPENVPRIVQSVADEMPVSVSGGRVHSLALTGKGEVWAWGCGRNGRLGLGSSADEVEPMFVESLEGSRVLQSVAGFDHNLVLVA